MPKPISSSAQRFYRVGKTRLDEANYLFQGNYNSGAVYLGGFAVECMLKALLIHRTAKRQRRTVEESFKGSHGHNFDWLKNQLIVSTKMNLAPITVNLRRVNSWNVSLRYENKAIASKDATRFLVDVARIVSWIDGSI